MRNRLAAISVLALLFGLGGVVTVHQAFAAAGNIYLRPSVSSVKTGETVKVSIRINPGTTVDSVQGTLTYDASKLQYVSVSTTGSAFSTELSNTHSGGSVGFARGDFGSGVSSDSLVETVTFKALSSTGVTSLGLSGANSASGGTFTNPSASGTSVTISAPASPKPTPKPTPTPSSSSTPKSSGSSSSTTPSGNGSTSSKPKTKASNPAKTTSQAAATVLRQNISYSEATLELKTAVPTTAYIRYGIGDDLSSQTSISGLARDHTISLNPSLLVPGERYSYVVVSTTQQGAQTTTEKRTLRLKGLTVAVRVLDESKQPLRKKKVTIHSEPQTVMTDDSGIATFTDVIPGKHRVIYKNGKEYSQGIDVDNNVKLTNGVAIAAVQNFSVVYPVANTSVLDAIVTCVLVSLILAGIAFVAYRKREQLAALPFVSQFIRKSTPAPVVNTIDEPTAQNPFQPTSTYSAPAEQPWQQNTNQPTQPPVNPPSTEQNQPPWEVKK